MKNAARMPRTAGLRTLSELTSGMTKAGLDPSRIQERANMLAKVAGAKRKRDLDEDDEMDVDGEREGEGDGEEADWMDVDGEEAPTKRAKANSGAVVAKGRHPRSQRQLAGMRDEAVSTLLLWSRENVGLIHYLERSKSRRPSKCGIWDRENATCTPRRARAIVLSGPRW